MLTNKEKELISFIVMDEETGCNLLFPRSKDYWKLKRELIEARESTLPNERQVFLLQESIICDQEII